MERNANYALVGLITTVLLICLAVFVVWLAGSKVNRDRDTYDIVFQGPVRGLADGGEVHFNGIKVGNVTKIGLDPRNAQLVIARVSVTSDIPIRKDSIAVLEPQGITGVNYIQISAGTPGQPLLNDTVPDGVVPRLASRRDAVSDLLANGGFVVQRSVDALDRINLLLSTENIHSLSATLSNVQSLTAELRERRSVIEDAQKTVQDADAAMQQFTALAKSSNALINGPARASLAKLDAALDEMRGATAELHTTIHGLSGPAQSFAATSLPQLTSAIQSLQTATDHLDRVVGQVESDPRGLIAKAPAKEVKIDP